MSKKNTFGKYKENDHNEYETAIDIDTGEEVEERDGEKDAREKITMLLEWAAKVRGKKFFDPVTQRKYLNLLRVKKYTPKQIKDAYIDALHSDYWKQQDRLPDFKTIYSNLKNKK